MSEVLPRSLPEVISDAITRFNVRQEALGGNQLSDREFAGIRSMILSEVQRWISSELMPTEQHFKDVGDGKDPDVLVERLLIYLVKEYGYQLSDGETGIVVDRQSLARTIGMLASVTVDDNGTTKVILDERNTGITYQAD